MKVSKLVEELNKKIKEGAISEDSVIVVPKQDDANALCVWREVDSIQYIGFGDLDQRCIFLNPKNYEEE